MPTMDVRPGRLDLKFRPGSQVTLELTWPAGVLDGRSFSAAVGDADASVSIDADLMTLILDGSESEGWTTPQQLALTEVEGSVVIAGTWTPYITGADAPGGTVAVLADVPQVTVEVAAVGAPGGVVDALVASTGILVDDTDPANPVVSVDDSVFATDAQVAAAVLVETTARIADVDAEEAARSAAIAALAAVYQPLDSDLSALAANGAPGATGLALLLAASATAARSTLGLVLGTDVYSKAAVDALLAASAAWRTVFQGKARLDAVAATTTGIHENGVNTGTGTAGGLNAFYLDPADLPAGATLRVRLSVLTNDTAPASSFTAGLYPIGAVGGAAAAQTAAFGSVVTGSQTPSVTTPAANTKSIAVTAAPIAVPAAGWYALGLVVSSNMAASSAVTVRGSVDVRY